VLLSAASDDSWNGIVRNGALAGLGLHRSKQAFDLLLARVVYGAEKERCRIAAVQALARAGTWQDNQDRNRAIEQLIALLRDSDSRLQWAAIRGLVQLEARNAHGAIAQAKKTLKAADGPAVDRQLKQLAESGRV